MKQLIIALAIALSSGLQSENNEMNIETKTRLITVLDYETKEVLAAVKAQNGKRVFYSNLDGVISKNTLMNDTVTLSLISYRSIKVLPNDTCNVFYLKKI